MHSRGIIAAALYLLIHQQIKHRVPARFTPPEENDHLHNICVLPNLSTECRAVRTYSLGILKENRLHFKYVSMLSEPAPFKTYGDFSDYCTCQAPLKSVWGQSSDWSALQNPCLRAPDFSTRKHGLGINCISSVESTPWDRFSSCRARNTLYGRSKITKSTVSVMEFQRLSLYPFTSQQNSTFSKCTPGALNLLSPIA